MQIRELTKTDAPIFRTLRLRALEEYPTVFSSSYEIERHWPLEAFADRLPDTPESTDSFILGCFVDGNLVGSIGFFRLEQPKLSHVGRIAEAHVAAEQQGRGYGRALVVAALQRARRLPGLSLIHLTATTIQRTRNRTLHLLFPRLRDLRDIPTRHARRRPLHRRTPNGPQARLTQHLGRVGCSSRPNRQCGPVSRPLAGEMSVGQRGPTPVGAGCKPARPLPAAFVRHPSYARLSISRISPNSQPAPQIDSADGVARSRRRESPYRSPCALRQPDASPSHSIVTNPSVQRSTSHPAPFIRVNIPHLTKLPIRPTNRLRRRRSRRSRRSRTCSTVAFNSHSPNTPFVLTSSQTA